MKFFSVSSAMSTSEPSRKIMSSLSTISVSFPAILSVITLYKQDVTQVDNFPRVTRDDFFNLKVGDTVEITITTNADADYILVNDSLDEAVENLHNLIQTRHYKTTHCEDLIESMRQQLNTLVSK